MERLFLALKPFIRWVVRHPWLVVAVAAILTVGGLYSASKLQVDTDLSKLIPQDYASVQALERLRDTVGGESEVAVAIVSPSFEANKRFAETFIDSALSLQRPGSGEPYLTRVDYRRDTEFLQNNALYFATPAELDSLEAYLQSKIEEASLEANPFFFELEEEEETDAAPDAAALSLATVYDQIVGKEYPVSEDSTVMVLRFYPSGSQTNIGFIESLYASLDSLAAAMQPAAYHPDMEITLAGRLQRQAVEVRAITNDVFSSFGVGVACVLLMVLGYFFYKSYRARAGRTFSGPVFLGELLRAPALALIIGLPLLMSLSWTFGLAYLSYGALNLMTSTLGLVLFGLGIDYGIHFYARYTEERAHGRSIEDAVVTTFASTGQAVAIGALTTAVALYVLVIADFRGFSEFGFISGTGILFALVAMLVVLPALLSIFERLGLLRLGESLSDDASAVQAPSKRNRRFPAAKPIVIGSFVAVVAALVLLPKAQFEYQFGELEPTYEEYNARREIVRRVYNDGGKRNPAYVVVDEADEVPAIMAALREKAARDTLTPTIGSVESLQERFPATAGAQKAKLNRIAEIRGILANPFLEAEQSADLDKLRRAAQTTEPIDLEQVPDFLKKQYMSKTGEIGNFIMIYPSVGLSDGRESMKFAEDVGTIVTEDGRTYHAGSTSLVAADMLRLMMKEAPWMIAATFTLVVVLMLLNFRSIKWAMVALIPLVVGVLWMLLLMEILGLKLNFYNLVVLPAILGIGNDAGVHIVHRYREEGLGSIRRVLRSTGEHVSMASLTTMVGFGGLLLSFHPGLRSIGALAVAGIGATLVAALLFLPAMLQWIEDRQDGAFQQEPSARTAAASNHSGDGVGHVQPKLHTP